MLEWYRFRSDAPLGTSHHAQALDKSRPTALPGQLQFAPLKRYVLEGAGDSCELSVADIRTDEVELEDIFLQLTSGSKDEAD